MNKTKLNKFDLFIDYQAPNGTCTLLLVDSDTDKIVDTLDEAVFGAHVQYGANSGVYEETCGGYAGQIHTAAYIGYDNDVMYGCSLENYECGCTECDSRGYDESTCEMRDWTMIDYLDNYENKLYWVDAHVLKRYAACSPVCSNGFERIIDFLKQHIDAEVLADALDASDMQRHMMLCDVLSK